MEHLSRSNTVFVQQMILARVDKCKKTIEESCVASASISGHKERPPPQCSCKADSQTQKRATALFVIPENNITSCKGIQFFLPLCQCVVAHRKN